MVLMPCVATADSNQLFPPFFLFVFPISSLGFFHAEIMFLDTPNVSNSIRVQGKGYNLPSTPLAVAVSPEEVKTNALSWRNLEIATRALHRDGIVILQDVIDHSKLGFLNDKMLGDAELLQKADYPIPYNFHKGFAATFFRPFVG